MFKYVGTRSEWRRMIALIFNAVNNLYDVIIINQITTKRFENKIL